MTEGILIERKTRGEQPPPGLNGSGAADAPDDQANTATAQPGSEPQTAPVDGNQNEGARKPPHHPAGAKSNSGKQEQAETEASKGSSAEVKQAQEKSGVATNGATLDTTPKSSSKEAKRLPSLERDVSPGTMPDGSHAQTSGDRGESYTPTTLSKLKSKLHIGGGK